MLSETFCSSPWFHFRINSDGSYTTCRWSLNAKTDKSLKTHTLLEFYNSEVMKQMRKDLLDGKKLDQCSNCYYEDSFDKLNGRQRQLLKSAVKVKEFNLTLRSSPHYPNFEFSYQNQGLANLYPVDLQIDLGNVCNNSCIMCYPEFSNRLQLDWQKLHKIESSIFTNPVVTVPWTKDEKLVKKFIDSLTEIPNLKYLHFLGGETLFEESFYRICQHLIDNGIAKNIIVGTTTNGTIYSDRLEYLMQNFKEFHLGISIESTTSLNDYIRYPSKIENVLENIDKFLKFRNLNPNLYVSLRITPNIFTIFEIDKLFVYMIENNVIAESCNILTNPDQLRIEILPSNIRETVKNKIKKIIDFYELESSEIINIRRNDYIPNVISNVILDYYRFISEYTVPDNIEPLRYKLVKFTKSFESIHKNSILDHIPQYEEFLRAYGY